ncbi:MAG: bifunctional diaminohydroxyphosphoribosylaminopyrimidine deaminase/5-amino-6-(5-phosphoribosylamino)uracil reductase RibD [Thermacetogeniaceae bacterium]|nr:bifunctional diaminohydroxyphosphoribosylaminopyrimidine deaminase/5-amino-6-(5-phosphoribosylamino)uracil reductase RibD [Thermoanaerobacterales bacterium]
MSNHEQLMARALKLAELGRGQTSPNPLVGAVVVKNGEIVGEGYHQRAGSPHAEINALREAGERARDAVLYVTLEPCCHYGRTPPCTKAIIEAGIQEVIVGVTDPNPQVAGKGIRILKESGIKVQVGVLEEEVRRQNEAFFKYIRTKLPFVSLKAAVSLDGKIATRSGDSKWITGEEARLLVHRLRAESDAVLTGIGTVLADDPLLNVRLSGYKGRQPLRIVVDSSLRIPEESQLVQTAAQIPTAVAVIRGNYSREKRERLEAIGVDVWELPASEGRVDLKSLLNLLGQKEIMNLLVEAGSAINAALLESRLVDKYIIFQAPLLIGGYNAPGAFGGKGFTRIKDCQRLSAVFTDRVGEDMIITAYPEWRSEAGSQKSE